ncbi:hypothetical protein IV203_012558 [Nitzschia inconspicua]|uniref:Uncharacterized protein n=1 Tax=Nitzschia inconspicua TaxID=303405 RepID=A0A9K3PKE5_9STRA|nr:hypothetical protein IV203_012558 [Nitzschia inconspicua]
MTLILDSSHYKTRDALLEAGLKAELQLLPEGVTACVPRWLLQRSDNSSIGRTTIITQKDGIATGTATGTFPPNNSPASSPSRNSNHNNNINNINKENNHYYEKEEEDFNSSCGNGMLLNTQSAVSFSYSDWNTVLPTIDWARCEPNILCTVATDVWIPILQQLSNVAVVTTATTTVDDFTNHINSNNPKQDIMANTTANHYRCCPHHFKVYHRLATILMGLAAMANHNNNNNNNNDSDSVKTSRDDDCLVLLQQIRSLAQRILKESRMKGRYGATHYYCWFTAVAGECSEALGDLACAHLAYKSVGKLESNFHGMRGRMMTLLPVYGTTNVPLSTTTTTTRIIEQSKTVYQESFDSNDGVVGEGYLGFPLGTRSNNNHSNSNNTSINKTVFPPPLLGAVIPPTLNDLAQHLKDHHVDVVVVVDTGISTNTAWNSKIGNRFVSTGSLVDRIYRTGSSDSLVVSRHDEISNGNNRNSSSSNNNNKTTSAVASYHHSGSLLVGNFDTANN